MKVLYSIFIEHSCPINSERESPLHISHCTFISCHSANEPGGIRWRSRGEDAFIDNIVVESCSSEHSEDFAYLKAGTTSVSIISVSCCRKGNHVIDVGDNSLVLNLNISHCEASFESLKFGEDQAEIRLARFNSCYATTYVILGFLSRMNRGSYIDVTNSTSASATSLGVLRAEAEIFLYCSNFIDNIGKVMFASVKAVKFNALNCYLRGLKNTSGILVTSSKEGWNSGANEIPIVGAEGGGGRGGYGRESWGRTMKVPMLVASFLPISTNIMYQTAEALKRAEPINRAFEKPS